MVYLFRGRGRLMIESYFWWAEFVLHHSLKVPQLWSSPFSGLQLSSSLSPLAVLCQLEIRDFWQKAICTFLKAQLLGGGDQAVRTLALLVFLLGLKNCLLSIPKWRLRVGNYFSRCLCISNTTSQRLFLSFFCISKRVYLSHQFSRHI